MLAGDSKAKNLPIEAEQGLSRSHFSQKDFDKKKLQSSSLPNRNTTHWLTEKEPQAKAHKHI